ncbi:MAG: glycosyltransferase family 4 protein [Desulfosporosinus sp.]|nr:glycosyltransferase family 4 protein [Desulfosporosinus sp.]
MKKRILQVYNIDWAASSFIKPLIQRLSFEGYLVDTACTDTGLFLKLAEEGYNFINVKIDRKISLLSNLKSILQLYRVIKRGKYDIVHVHTPVASILGRIAAKLAGVKHVIYTAHGFYFHEAMSRNRYRAAYMLEKFFARFFTDWIFLQSVEDYQLCITKKFKTSDRVLHISNGVDITKKFNPVTIEPSAKLRLKKELGITDDQVVFSFVGRVVREKGVFELLEAFEGVLQTNNKVRLLIIGDTLSSDRDQKTAGKLLEITSHPNINVLGMRTDIPQLLAITDVFVLPSYREGVPRSVIEAMAMAKPIIATNIRGCRETVVQGGNGYLVPKGDSDALGMRMLELANDSVLRARFSDKSREIAEQRFNEEDVICKQLNVIRRLQ